MLIKKDDQSGEQAMQGDGKYNGSMNGALDKTERQWPSSIVSIPISKTQLGDETSSVSVW